MRAQPRRLNLLIGALFVVGSACFAIGTVTWYVQAVGAFADALTYFVGSIFFTSASFLQLVQSQTPAASPGTGLSGEQVRLRFWNPRPGDRSWLAAAFQFPGTLAFNVSTAFAISTSLTLEQTNRLIWAPDFVGSTLFLISSGLAVMAVGPRPFSWRWTDLGWRIAWLNMVGSVFFMLSALGSLLLPGTGTAFNSQWAALGTFLGAVCFLWGAALLPAYWREMSTPGSG